MPLTEAERDQIIERLIEALPTNEERLRFIGRLVKKLKSTMTPEQEDAFNKEFSAGLNKIFIAML